jgi:hypothetical protein
MKKIISETQEKIILLKEFLELISEENESNITQVSKNFA